MADVGQKGTGGPQRAQSPAGPLFIEAGYPPGMTWNIRPIKT
jgi:hypothetical protein